jgi:hypothetical protein
MAAAATQEKVWRDVSVGNEGVARLPKQATVVDDLLLNARRPLMKRR